MKSFYNINSSIGCAALFILLALTTASYGQLVINEVQGRLKADDPATLAIEEGDTNGDGQRNTTNDEFIELANSSGASLDISGWSVTTTTGAAPGTKQHVFPTGTILPPGGVIVIFGGPYDSDDNGTADGSYSSSGFGGSIVQIADDNGDAVGGAIGLTLTDAGCTVRIYTVSSPTAGDVPHASLTYTHAAIDAGTSVGRINPDVTGALSTTPNHPVLNGKNFSPGLKADGTPFITNVKFNAASATVNEGSATYNLVIDVLNPSATTATEFDVALTAGSNTDIESYTTVHKTVGVNEVQTTVSITITDDAFLEGNEVLTFSLQNISGGNNAAIVTPSQFSLTIEDNDITKVSFVSSSATVNENAGTYQLQVAIENPSPTTATTVDVALTSGTASDLNSYTTTTATFPANSSANQTVTVTITDDAETEGSEVFTFQLQNAQGGVTAGIGTTNSFDLTVSASDIPPLVINEVLPWPAGGGLNPNDLTVDANGDGTATGLADEMIELVNAGVTSLDVSGWKAGDASVRFTFPASTILQPGEAVVIFGGYSGTAPTRINGSRVFIGSDAANGLGLSNTGDVANVWNQNNVLIASYTYSTGIENGKSFVRVPDISGGFAIHPTLNSKFISPGLKSDGTVFTTQINFASTAATASESDGTYNIVIDLRHPTGAVGDTEFDLVLTSGTAVDIGNYNTVHRVVPAGTNQVTIPVTITDDTDLESAEGFTFGIQNLSGGVSPAITSSAVFTLTLNDNDVTSVSFVSASATRLEGAGTYQIEVAIQNPSPSSATTVDVALTSGTASDLGNYVTTTLTFPANSSGNQSATVTITDDTETEPDEIFTFNLQNPLGGISAIIGSGNTFNLTISANDIPPLVINEVLPWPAAGNGPVVTVDANGDGASGGFSDEMIELVNAGVTSLDVSGWKVGDASVRFTFPASTILQPGEAVVIFGGYSGTAPTRINGSRVFIGSDAANGLGLSNTGDVANVWNQNNVLVASYTYSTGIESGKSFVRVPDINGGFAIHPTLNSKFISPGLKSDGTVFTTQINFASAAATASESDGTYNIVIDLRNPTGAVGDTEFDLVLTSGTSVDIGNYSTVHRVVPAGTNQITIPVTITDDTNLESAEGFTFEIQNLSGGSSPVITTANQFTLTINDNDRTQIFFTTTSATVNEGDGIYQLQVTISNPDPSNATTARVVLTNGTNNDLNNYQTVDINFPAGSPANQTVPVTITDDTSVELNETFTFAIQDISGGNNAAVGANGTFTLTIIDNDVSTGPAIVINEFCPFPSISAEGGVDANGDKSTNGNTDEFIELVNSGNTNLDISGWRIYGGTTPTLRYTFESNIILKPGEAVVVFGGWNITTGGPSPKKIGPSRVFFGSVGTAPNVGLGMTNTGATIEVRDGSNIVQASYTYTGAEAVNSISRVLNPEITGTTYVAHPLLSTKTISPGTKIDGSPFIVITTTVVEFEKTEGGKYEGDLTEYAIAVIITRPDATVATTLNITVTTANNSSDILVAPSSLTFAPGETSAKYVSVNVLDDNELEGDEIFELSITNVTGGDEAEVGESDKFHFRIYDNDVPVIFNEVHASPATDISGDANRDGTRDAIQDEFVELVNVTDSTINLSGWKLFDDKNVLRHQFLPGTKLPDGTAMVIFGAGVPIGPFGAAQYQIASEGGLGLTDNGSGVILRDAQNNLKSSFFYGAEGNVKQSLTRNPDVTGLYISHSECADAGNKLFSPGTRTNGTPFLSLVTSISETTNPVTFYPNPVRLYATLSVSQMVSVFDVTILDATGKPVMLKKGITTKEVTIDMSQLRNGLYLYRIHSSSDKLLGTGKFLIVH